MNLDNEIIVMELHREVNTITPDQAGKKSISPEQFRYLQRIIWRMKRTNRKFSDSEAQTDPEKYKWMPNSGAKEQKRYQSGGCPGGRMRAMIGSNAGPGN